MKPRGLTILVLMLFAVPLMALNVALFVTGNLAADTLVPTLAALSVVFLMFWFFVFRGQPVDTDERTIGVARKAMMYSWFFSLYVVFLLSGSDTLGLLHLSGPRYLGVIMQVMTFSFLFLLIVLNRRGDGA